MKNYVIIEATAIQKRIEELEILEKQESMHASLLVREEIETLKKVLSQSTPLVPEIKKAYTKAFSEGIVFGMHTEYKYKTTEDYIANLKLDI